jgi:N-acetylglucosaminyldiphosphoundecaprenol N-acetyl-beta-D-mannosaminyltransferase
MADAEILGVRVHHVDRATLEKEILEEARNGQPKVFLYANVHAINTAQRDARFRNILNRSSVTYCDGEGVRWGARLLGGHLPKRTALTTWVWDLCSLLQDHNLSAFFLGGSEEASAKACDVIRSRFPRLRIAGRHHGFFLRTGAENDAVIRAICSAAPDVLFVGFGIPIQEYWIEDNLARLKASVILSAGSMIEYVSGAKKAAPRWMANNGLEWFFRLLHEPRRLWRRYLIGNPLFLFRVIRQRLRSGRG